MRNLIADRPILCGGRMYPVGASLPVCRLTDAWISAGSAHWADEETVEAPDTAPAEPETVEAPDKKPVRTGRNRS